MAYVLFSEQIENRKVREMGRELERRKSFMEMQLLGICMLVAAGIGLWIFAKFFPSFFVYHYLQWGGWDSVWRFWPIFVWGTIVSLLFNYINEPVSDSENRQLFKYGFFISIIAGIWEELGFRWVFIFYAMIGTVVSNWIFSSVIGWVMAVALVIVGLGLIPKNFIASIFFLALGCGVMWLLLSIDVDVVYWFYENILIKIVGLTSFGMMDSILFRTPDRLFIFGALAANAWFRDGHKNQGFFGFVNSWYLGLILLYATFTYGLFTAMVVHALYDILVFFAIFIKEKTA